MQDISKNLKKIELHLHLDGSVDINTASRLLGLSINKIKKNMIAGEKCLNLTEYLKKFDLPDSIMQTKDNLIQVSKDLVNYLENENVIYAEVRFAPMFHTKEGLSYEDVVDAVLEGFRSNDKVKTNLILCMMRGMDKEDNMKTIEIAHKYLGRGVCAIDLAGDECNYPIDKYLNLFDVAKEYGIPFTIHAGESGSAMEVRKAIMIGAKRIGHGIHAVDDPSVIELIKKRNVLLEVCPTSNVQTNVVREYKEHPICDLIKNGVNVCINTDNKTVSNISISDEYRKLIDNFNFDYSIFKKMNTNAVKGSFLSEEEKLKLLKELGY